MRWWQNLLLGLMVVLALIIRAIPVQKILDILVKQPDEPAEPDAAADGGSGTILDVGPTDPSLLRGLGSVGLAFLLGSLVGYNWAQIRDEPDVPPLETGLAIGGFYAVLVGGGLACARIYHRVRPPGTPPSGLSEGGWVRSALALPPARVAVSIVGLLALLAILLIALLPYGAVTVEGEKHRCGSPLVQVIRPDDGELASRASTGSDDGTLRGSQACLSEAKHRRGLLVALSAITLVGVGSGWLVSGGKRKGRP